MPTVVVPIRNMHCKSCVLLLESSLREVPGVKSVSVSLKKQQASIQADEGLDLAEVHAAIEEAGYKVGEHTDVPWFSRNGDEYALVVVAFFLALTIVSVIRFAGLDALLNLVPSGSSGLFPVMLIGLTAGVSTCMALVGGLVLAVSARHAAKHPRATILQKFRPHVFFNLGRVAGFFLLGGVLGAVGSLLQLTSLWLGFITMAVGLVMLLLGLQLLSIFPKLERINISLPLSIGRFLGISRMPEREYSHIGAVTAGALTFFLPCGFTQAMQVAAVGSGSFLRGGLIMGAFALGTIPGLLSLGGILSVVRGIGANIFFKVVGVMVVGLALFNITSGYRLTGWVIPWQGIVLISDEDANNVVQQDGVQVVAMTQAANGFSPNQFVVKRGIPVRWVINATSTISCSSTIVVPALGIQRTLTLGENVIEFTPQNLGTIRFTCSMGMYPGQFVVTE